MGNAFVGKCFIFKRIYLIIQDYLKYLRFSFFRNFIKFLALCVLQTFPRVWISQVAEAVVVPAKGQYCHRLTQVLLSDK